MTLVLPLQPRMDSDCRERLNQETDVEQKKSNQTGISVDECPGLSSCLQPCRTAAMLTWKTPPS